MKTLKFHTLVYDDQCPLCKMYTRAFISCGMLDEQGRVPYQQYDPGLSQIDMELARNKIALVNVQDGTVDYGADSLVKVLGNNFPVIARLYSFKLVSAFIGWLYALISYNRKVIVPCGKDAVSCEPTFNLFWRTAYLLFCLIVSSAAIFAFTSQVPVAGHSGFGRELMICAGQLFFQAAVLAILKKKRWVEYF